MILRKTHVMSIDEFLRGEYKTKLNRKVIITFAIVGSMVIIILLSPSALAANSAIDVAGRKVYYKLVNIGKWIIIFKGGIDVIKSITNGDIDGAKKSFLTYSLAYMLLLALPWGLDTVDEVFKDISW